MPPKKRRRRFSRPSRSSKTRKTQSRSAGASASATSSASSATASASSAGEAASRSAAGGSDGAQSSSGAQDAPAHASDAGGASPRPQLVVRLRMPHSDSPEASDADGESGTDDEGEDVGAGAGASAGAGAHSDIAVAHASAEDGAAPLPVRLPQRAADWTAASVVRFMRRSDRPMTLALEPAIAWIKAPERLDGLYSCVFKDAYGTWGPLVHLTAADLEGNPRYSVRVLGADRTAERERRADLLKSAERTAHPLPAWMTSAANPPQRSALIERVFATNPARRFEDAD